MGQHQNLIIAGVVLMVALPIVYFQNSNIKDNWYQTSATILTYDVIRDRNFARNESRRKCVYEYEYQYENQKYTGREKDDRNCYQVGEKIRIYVNPEDPSESKIFHSEN